MLFISNPGIQDVEKQMSVTRMLITLLPVPNRDTLWSLLQFLFKVNEHSTDAIDENGLTVSQCLYHKLIRTTLCAKRT